MKTRNFILILMTVMSCGLSSESALATDLELFGGSRKWQFLPGVEFPPGGSGGFDTATEEGKDIGVLDYDFSAGGAYVAAQCYLSLPQGFSDLRFKVKSELPQKVGIRLVDSEEEVFQYEVAYSDTGEWQELNIDLNGKPSNHWGGNKDGVIQYPIKQLLFLINRPKDNPAGTVQFSEIKLLK